MIGLMIGAVVIHPCRQYDKRELWPLLLGIAWLVALSARSSVISGQAISNARSYARRTLANLRKASFAGEQAASMGSIPAARLSWQRLWMDLD